MQPGDLVQLAAEFLSCSESREIGVVIRIYEKSWNDQQDIDVLWGDGIYTNLVKDLEVCNA